MSSISPFDIISTEAPESKIFLCIPAAADAPTVYPNRTKTLLANGLNTFLLMVILF